jgi:Na+-translocating ferredoxin:NAD+ oxidoreductase RnfC subunit
MNQEGDGLSLAGKADECIKVGNLVLGQNLILDAGYLVAFHSILNGVVDSIEKEYPQYEKISLLKRLKFNIKEMIEGTSFTLRKRRQLPVTCIEELLARIEEWKNIPPFSYVQ